MSPVIARRAILAIVLCFSATAAAGAAGKDVYATFDVFCRQRFGAQKEPLIYDKAGKDLKFLEDGAWRHVSVQSACVAFETNLPAKAYVEYGPTRSYGEKTKPHGRRHYIHVHYLTGLKPGASVHYRLVAVDERGNQITSPDQIFKTVEFSGVKRIPEDLGQPPYKLKQRGATYVVTKDLIIDGLAFDFTAADVTLDLGGHTVTYNNKRMGQIKGDFWAYVHTSAFGVRAMKSANRFQIVNGTIKQGAGNDAAQANSIGFSPVYINGCQGEIAGVTIDYSGDQVTGIATHWANDGHVHHNVIIDRGATVTNRHQGVDAIKRSGHVHHNLVKRARQRGLYGEHVHNNEIYLDSYATNSTGVRGKKAHHNRVFGTGYHICGFWWDNGITVRDNIIHLEGSKPGGRWSEYGDQVSLNGIRLTQYSGGKKPYENNEYYGNLIRITAREGTQARGVQFFSDPYVKNLVFRDNVVKVTAADWTSKQAACIVTQGNPGRTPEHLPILYSNNTLISNICNIRFGDYYGVGSNHHFVNCRIVKIGDDPRYKTFSYDLGSSCKNHILRDCTYQGGASPENVTWVDAKADHDFTVEWTLSITTAPNAEIRVQDRPGKEVFAGKASGKGELAVPLAQYKAKPTGKEAATPHTVVVTKDGKTRRQQVTVNKPQSIDVQVTDQEQANKRQ